MSADRIPNRFLILLMLLLCSSTTAASQAATDNALWQEQRSLYAAADGLLFSLPTVNSVQLRHQVNRLNLQLKERQQELLSLLQQNRFTAGDAVVVAVLPGGLIYAALKRQRSAQAEAELLQVATQLEALQGFPTPQHEVLPERTLLAAR